MEITIADVDHAPDDLYDQTPIIIELLKEIPGSDRPDYWLGIAKTPIRWRHGKTDQEITHVIVVARWEGTRIEPGIEDMPIGLAYVLDQSLLDNDTLDFGKIRYVAIGTATETSGETLA